MHMEEFSIATGIDPERDLESFACSIDVGHHTEIPCCAEALDGVLVQGRGVHAHAYHR